jgi:hypothetical protein
MLIGPSGKSGGLYRSHVAGELTPSRFIGMARAELHALYMQHTNELIGATVDMVREELRSFQTQFGLDLVCDWHLFQVCRGYRGIRAKIHIHNKEYVYSSGAVEIFIGPVDEWNRIAVHTPKEREEWHFPSLYTKSRRSSWHAVQDFNFPDLLQQIKEDVERPAPEFEDDDDIPF